MSVQKIPVRTVALVSTVPEVTVASVRLVTLENIVKEVKSETDSNGL